MAEILVQPMLAILLFAQAPPNAEDLLRWEDSMQLARQQAEAGSGLSNARPIILGVLDNLR